MRVAKLYEGAKLPTRKHPTDAGMDLYAYIPKLTGEGLEGIDKYNIILPGGIAIINTGITVEIPEGYVGLIWPKSKNNHLVGGGVVDAGYQGEILVKIISTRGMEVHDGDPIAQMVIVPVETPEIEEVSKDEIHKETTSRGNTGGIVGQSDYKVLAEQYIMGELDV